MIGHFPPELLSHIAWHVSGLQYDSEGDSNPILALSLVSKYLYQVALPYLFHTVRVSDTRKIFVLDEALRPPSNHVYVRHLHLSPTSHQPQGVSNPDLVRAVFRVLSHTAPTLQSLSLDFCKATPESTLVFSRLFRTSFPQLEFLALGGFYPNPSGSGPSRFPKVRRLHLHGNRNPHGLLQLGCVSNTFPLLTHLKISGLSMAVSFALELEEALGVAPISSSRNSARDGDPFLGVLDDEDTVPQLPATLTHLDILPAPSASVPAISSNVNVTACLKDGAMMERLRSIAESLSRGDEDKSGEGELRFRLLDRDVVGEVEGGSSLRREWEGWVGRER